MILIKNLVKKYDSNSIINDLSVTLEDKINFLFGSNGSGKSTLIKILAGVVKADSGLITINNKKLSYQDGTYKKNIGFCLDFPTYPAHLKLKEYINILNYVYNIDYVEKKNYQDDLIIFFELTNYLDEQISNLSSGYEKRVKLLASMLHNPELFIWDEPFANLDKKFVLKLSNKIKELSKEGKSFFITSHLTEALSVDFSTSKKYMMKEGKIEIIE